MLTQNNTTMKISMLLSIATAICGLCSFVYSQELERRELAELPEQAKRIVEQLEKYEERELKDVEEEILKKKKDVLRSLERSEKRIDSEGVLRHYAQLLKSLNEEISASERFINGDEENDIVEYGVVYRYRHPMQFLSKLKGEMIFSRNNKVKMMLKDNDGNDSFNNELKWEFKNGELIINDVIQGEIIISSRLQRDKSRLKMEWSRLNKSSTAEAE